MTKIALTVNGKRHEAESSRGSCSAYFLRDDLGLTGTNVGCDTSSCGACTVLLDGESAKSCTVLAVQADGREVTTIEGISDGDQLHPVQQAFHEEHALQCGYCTPGFVLATISLLKREPEPDRAGDPPRARGQPLPLHRVPQHRPSGPGRGEGRRVIPASFEYARAGSVDEAVALLGGDEDAKLLAGGHSLVPPCACAFARPSLLVDIGRLDELRYVRDDGERIAIGALTRHAALVSDPVLAQHCAVIGETAALIGDPQVRHRGTIGGSVAHGDPASDLSDGSAHPRRRLRRAGDGRGEDNPGGGVLHRPVRHGPHAAGDPHRDPDPEGGCGDVPQARAPGAGLGDRRRRRRPRRRTHAGRPHEHGADTAPGPRRRGGAGRGSLCSGSRRTRRRSHRAAERCQREQRVSSTPRAGTRPARCRPTVEASPGVAPGGTTLQFRSRRPPRGAHRRLREAS